MMHVSLDAIDRVQRVVGSLSLINERPLPPRDGGCGRLVRDGKALVDEPGRFDLINERNSVILARTTCQKTYLCKESEVPDQPVPLMSIDA